MPFFELPDAPQQKPERRRRLRREEPWQRPATVLPGYLGEDFVLASNDEVAVVMRAIACYPNGFAFELHTVTRYGVDPEDAAHYTMSFPHERRGRDVSPTLLRFGIAFSNGEKATTLESHPFGRDDNLTATEPRPHLMPEGGGGGGGDWRQQMWVWPLPPPGPVTFACEWPAFGIDETLHEIEGDRFRHAADSASPLF